MSADLPVPNVEEVMRTPPLERDQFPTLDDARDYLKEHASRSGFAVVVKSSAKNFVAYQCDRGGEPRKKEPHADEAKRRKTNTRRIGCPFRANVSEKKRDGYWKPEITNPSHNHEPEPDEAFPTVRHAQLMQHADLIATGASLGQPPRTIRAMIQETAGVSLLATSQDISNAVLKDRNAILDGKTPLQALLIIFGDNPDWHVRYDAPDSSNHELKSVFLAHKSSIALLKRNPYVLIADCTYKTNKYVTKNYALFESLWTSSYLRKQVQNAPVKLHRGSSVEQPVLRRLRLHGE